MTDERIKELAIGFFMLPTGTDEELREAFNLYLENKKDFVCVFDAVQNSDILLKPKGGCREMKQIEDWRKQVRAALRNPAIPESARILFKELLKD
jgi:hypothetical protein